MKLLSIIVPIYNVEDYLKKCILSIEEQDIPEDGFEVICVNDGSPDKSREIVIGLQQKYNNIILIDQENQGVSRARNNGIKRATGEYLLFIDPDDFISKNSLKAILDIVFLKNAQMAICGYSFLDQYGQETGKRTYDQYTDRIFKGIEAYLLVREKNPIQRDLSVGIFYKTDFLKKNNLYFLPDVPYLEDGEFLVRVHALASSCIFIKGKFYINTVRPGSATHSTLYYSERARNGFQKAAVNLKELKKAPNLNEEQITFLNRPVLQFAFLSILSAIHERSFKSYKSTIYNLRKKGLNKLSMKGCKGYYLIFGVFYNVSLHFGAVSLILYYKLVNLFKS